MLKVPCAGALKLLASAAIFFALAPAGAQQEPDAPQPGYEQPDNAPVAPPRRDEQPLDEQPREARPRAEQPRRASPAYGPETANATAHAARRYATIAASGGWPRIAKPLGANASGRPVALLRRRLAIEGYLPNPQDSGDNVWDDALGDALRRFQAHMGLEQTGDVSRETLRELNIPAATRARELEMTAARLAKMHFRFGDRYVDVNIPAASVEAVEDGDAIARFTAVVGGRRHRSPQVVTHIVSIDLNPTWTVPASIIKKELAPKLRRNPHYFERENIRILDARGREVDPLKLRRVSNKRAAHFTFRQEPGPKNALGSLRISMPNSHDVYMHDTPNKKLFDRDYRFLSHGCVRVEGVYDLASWLLDETSRDWTPDALRDAIDSGRSEKIRLSQSVPVAWVYMTGWAEDDGPAFFRHDIYNLDRGARSPTRRR
ncbi:L,D-transpeptidase family protein [Methylocystis sp. JR02]|uniref:L,D-transpeptidase family protein n=1 Tax=Methylocystis sp. JR02 TaxID=3046284 RepID=UPI0024BBDC8E|nr:L,D-transpeptidase family protein [Methylocystis sp. JR02]MDJ0447338.1 L,D-transpeptidase family protein [Methylocystis sp. JR02]